MLNNFFIIIPSRIGSTRLEKKPLVKILGHTLIERVFMNALNITKNVYVATDSDEIFDHVKTFTKNVVMTSSKHISGTDRVYEAASILGFNDEDFIVNLQGDEPFMTGTLLNQLVEDFFIKNPDVISACHKIYNKADITDSNCVKVGLDENGFADTFERILTKPYDNYIMRHIGIYGYKYKTLSKIVTLNHSSNEIKHKLEQLRFLDNNLSIYMTKYSKEVPPGIDTKADLIRAEDYLRTL
jgi:3-deoxy-manno-octulosonate cytidylyltransferase (CMP-KDO synthetase)